MIKLRDTAFLLLALALASGGYSQVSYYRDTNDSWEENNDYEFNRKNRGDYDITLRHVHKKRRHRLLLRGLPRHDGLSHNVSFWG